MEQEFYVGDLVVIKDEKFLKSHEDDWPSINSNMIEAHDQTCVVLRVNPDVGILSLEPKDMSFMSSVYGYSWRTEWVIKDKPEIAVSEESFLSLFD